MNIKKLLLTLLSVAIIGPAMAAGGGGYPHEPFKANIHNQESLQRGARYFMNFCAGCHGLEYQRYNRTFKDLGIDSEIGKDNLIFTGAGVVEQMHSAMQKEEAAKWLGTAPPDLSLTARAKSGQYVYNYLLGFYVDESRPLGFNNSVFPGASMPNPLWQFQGLQVPVYEEHQSCIDGQCSTSKVIAGFDLVQKGSMNAKEYQQLSYDIANFLTYVSDPSALNRAAMGHWVLLFMVFLTIIFYFLKREYWRDIK